MAKTKKTQTKKRTWRDIADATHRSFEDLPSAESTHPGPHTVIAAVCGSPEHRSIIDSYAFRFPVTTVEVLD